MERETITVTIEKWHELVNAKGELIACHKAFKNMEVRALQAEQKCEDLEKAALKKDRTMAEELVELRNEIRLLREELEHNRPRGAAARGLFVNMGRLDQ